MTTISDQEKEITGLKVKVEKEQKQSSDLKKASMESTNKLAAVKKSLDSEKKEKAQLQEKLEVSICCPSL